MFSQTSEYALRVVVYLASLDGKPATIPRIAAATRTPEGYLAKVLRGLALAELVRSQRGPQGGSVLARPAEQITVYDVIQAVDPIRRITTCPLNIRAHGVNLCPLHRRLDQAMGLVEDAFRATPIAELAGTPAAPQALCDLPARRRGGRGPGRGPGRVRA
jgi:Rrf2 family transcriptional regulator, nitric oxide-sensitive transcriptional repressor